MYIFFKNRKIIRHLKLEFITLVISFLNVVKCLPEHSHDSERLGLTKSYKAAYPPPPHS